MTISDEIKVLLIQTGKKQKDLAPSLGVTSPQAVTNKIKLNRWSAADLIRVVNYLGGKLVIEVGDRRVELTEDHIAK